MERVEEFAEETCVFGLNLMRRRVPKIEKIFWIALIIVCSILTIRDARGVINSFIESDALTSVNLNDDEPVNLDPAVALLMDKAFVQQSNISNDSLLSILNSTFSQTRYPENLPDLLFETNIRLFDHISFEIEMPTLFPQSFSNPDSIDFDLLTVYNFYREKNISLAYLRRVTSAMLCEKIGFRVEFPEDKNARNICSSDFVAEMHGFILVMKLSSRPIEFRAPTQNLRIVIGRDYVRLIENIFIDLEGLLLVYGQRSAAAIIQIKLGKNQNTYEVVGIAIRPLLKFRKIKRANHECSNEPVTDCETRCAMQQFYECSRCWPFGAPLRFQPINNTELCPGDQLLTLSKTLDSCFSNRNRTINETYWTKCENMCKVSLRACEMRMFTNTESRWHGESFAIECSIQSFSFPIFEEKLALTWEAFISQFGGAISLYLGISFASLVHIPIFFMRLLLTAAFRRKTVKISEAPIKLEPRFASTQELSSIAQRLTAVEQRLSLHSTLLSTQSNAQPP